MNSLTQQLRKILTTLGSPARSTVALETIALLVGAAAFAVGFVISFLVFLGHELTIVGPGSIGIYAAIGGAVVAAIAFTIGRVAVRPVRVPDAPAEAVRDGFAVTGEHLRWYDLIAIGAAHSAIAFLGWLGIAELLSMSFTGAPVFAFPGAILVSVAFALTSYVVFLSAAALTPMTLSLVLAIFLVVGAFTAMLTSSDPDWWRDNLSALGMTSNGASPAFNGTLIIAGIIVTTIARYATVGLPVATPAARRSRRLVRIALVLIGVMLACVGIFPVDAFFLVHNTVATGMAVAFAALVIGLPWLLPQVSRVFLALGYIYVAVIVLLAAFFAVGYYNLTAVELIAAVLIFSWIIVFLRTVSVTNAPRH